MEKCTLNLSTNLRELQPHGTPEFSCAGYLSEEKNSGQYYIPWHWHEEMELIYTEEGCLTVQIPGKSFLLEKGCCIFINSNILHKAETQNKWKLHSLVFHPKLLTGTDESVFAKKYINPLIKTLDSYFFTGKNEWELSVISNIKKAFNSVMKNDTGYEFTVRENLSKVCFEIYNLNKKDIFKKNDDSDNDKKRIKLMVEYINQNFHRNISLSQIASSANIGERECMRCFQRMLKISPIQYLMKHRISKGALMLESSSNISLVSRECGFRSPSNFSKTFKKFYKCSPKDYRKKYKKIV